MHGGREEDEDDWQEKTGEWFDRERHDYGVLTFVSSSVTLSPNEYIW